MSTASVRFASNGGGGPKNRPPFPPPHQRNAGGGSSPAPTKKGKKIEIVLEDGQKFSVEQSTSGIVSIGDKALKMLGMDEDEPGFVEYFNEQQNDWQLIDDLHDLEPSDLAKLSKIKVRFLPEMEDESHDDSDNADYDDSDRIVMNRGSQVVNGLAGDAVEQGFVKPGGPLPSEDAVREFVLRRAAANSMVADYITGNIGGLEHLVTCLQLPFVYDDHSDPNLKDQQDK
jgi:hypothetical protein